MGKDKINPEHYKSHPSGVECIELAEQMTFNLGNAFKYLWRLGSKDDDVTNLGKALWYVNREYGRLITNTPVSSRNHQLEEFHSQSATRHDHLRGDTGKLVIPGQPTRSITIQLIYSVHYGKESVPKTLRVCKDMIEKMIKDREEFT